MDSQKGFFSEKSADVCMNHQVKMSIKEIVMDGKTKGSRTSS